MRHTISDSEIYVMQVLWKNAPQTADQIVRRLQENHDWHEKTIKTMLNRLVKKGFLDFSKQQRCYLYKPTIDEYTYQKQASRNFIGRLYRGQISPLVAQFAEQELLTPDDIESLKDLLNKLENPHG